MVFKKSIQTYMRAVHRDIGYFVIGITIIYSLSGTLMIYRKTDFLKTEKQIERQLPLNLTGSELGNALHRGEFRILKSEGDSIFFPEGVYNKTTGMAKYTENVLPPLLDRLIKVHRTSSHEITHFLSAIFGLLLLFLAISSFWMYKPTTKMFRRSLYFTGAGLILALILLFI